MSSGGEKGKSKIIIGLSPNIQKNTFYIFLLNAYNDENDAPSILTRMCFNLNKNFPNL